MNESPLMKRLLWSGLLAGTGALATLLAARVSAPLPGRGLVWAGVSVIVIATIGSDYRKARTFVLS